MIPLHMAGLLLQTTGLGTVPNAAAAIMPLVFIALLIDAFVVAIWYFIGVAINNSGVKASAMGEFYQFIGTAIMIGIIIGSLTTLSSIYYSSLSATKLMSPSSLNTLCTGIERTTSFDLLGKTGSLLSGPSNNQGSFPGLCSLANPSASSSLTDKLDYPLAATSVIVANLTNQTVANLNYSFTLDSWFGFLANLNPTVAICIDKTPAPGCIIPNPFITPLFTVEVSYAPYAGYNFILQNLSTYNTLLNLSVESFVVQLLVITIFLYIWPYILFAGFVLRSTFFTRRLGGLLIAAVITVLFIFPTVFAFEYIALGNGLNIGNNGTSTNGLNTTYGFNAITNIPAASGTGNYIVNFFVEPNVKSIALNYSCWPALNAIARNVSGFQNGFPKDGINPLFQAEGADIIYLALPGTQAVSGIAYLINNIFNSQPNYYLPAYCAPSDALRTFYALLNSYGIIGITSWLLPILNLVITISSMLGLSQLFGGDTQLAGLARLF
jgi:hypothetical protein